MLWASLLALFVISWAGASSGRPLGAYERLLSRAVPVSGAQALAHACVVALAPPVTHGHLTQAMEEVVRRHAMLRVMLDAGDRGRKPQWRLVCDTPAEIVKKAIRLEKHPHDVLSPSAPQGKALAHTLFDDILNNAKFSVDEVRWRLTHLPTATQSLLVFGFDHGIDDQESVHLLTNDLLNCLNSDQHAMPPTIEEAVGPGSPSLNTVSWALYQLKNSLSQPILLPKRLIADNNAREAIANPNMRKTVTRWFSIQSSHLQALKAACRRANVSVTHALAAAVSLLTYNVIYDQAPGAQIASGFDQLRFLLSVGLRRYGRNLAPGEGDFTGGTVACASGAVDYLLSIPRDSLAVIQRHIASLRRNSTTADEETARKFEKIFWQIAQASQRQADDVIVRRRYVPESVRLFGFGMDVVDVLQAVDIDAKSATSLGRGYTCGVSNMGLVRLTNDGGADAGTHRVEEIYYGTSHSRNGVLCQLSCLTLSTRFCGCLQFPSPIVSDGQADDLVNALTQLLRRWQFHN